MNDSEIYTCHRCGAVDVKLWREAQTLNPMLKCVDCLAEWLGGTEWAFSVQTINADGTRWHPTRGHKTDQIGWWLPAVQIMSMEPDLVFWGYTSTTAEDYLRWAALPLRMTEDT